MLVPVAAVAKHLPPGEPPAPDAPGPFALVDAQRVEGILTAAGFEDVHHESLVKELLVGGGGSLDETVGFVLQIGPLGNALREAGRDVREAATRDVRATLEPYHDGEGVRLPAAAWIVAASRPR